ncbi:MAG: hypothetical protein LBJ32_02325 [Oscillospiraceae bacterium]|nr:hypothetical protein [Oscillospiraceae bacterium]
MPELDSKKFKKFKRKNFSKTLAASLAVLNLFASNFLVKTFDKNDSNEQNSEIDPPENSYKKITGKKNIVKNNKKDFPNSAVELLKADKIKIKKIIKCTSLGSLLFLIYFKYNIKDDILSKKSRQWFKGFNAQIKIRDKLKNNFATFKERQSFIKFFLEAICLTEQFLEILSRKIDFKNYKDSGKVTIKDTGVVLDFNLFDPLKKYNYAYETVIKALGDSALSFHFLVKILHVLEDVFKSNFFGCDHGPFFVMGYKIKDIKNIKQMVNFENVFKCVYKKEETLKYLNKSKENLSELLINKNVSDFLKYI